MPLTPRFSIAQDSSSVIITIKVPYVKISKTDVYIDGKEFNFHCVQYILKLEFPFELEEDEEKYNAVYDVNNDNGTIVITVNKKVEGQYFPGLDLMSSLLQSKVKEMSKNKIIDELSTSFDESLSIDNIEDVGLLESFAIDHSVDLSVNNDNVFYGFALNYTGVLRHILNSNHDYINQLLECPYSPDDSIEKRSVYYDTSLLQSLPGDVFTVSNMDALQRRVLRLTTEQLKFDSKRYINDMLVYFKATQVPKNRILLEDSDVYLLYH